MKALSFLIVSLTTLISATGNAGTAPFKLTGYSDGRYSSCEASEAANKEVIRHQAFETCLANGSNDYDNDRWFSDCDCFSGGSCIAHVTGYFRCSTESVGTPPFKLTGYSSGKYSSCEASEVANKEVIRHKAFEQCLANGSNDYTSIKWFSDCDCFSGGSCIAHVTGYFKCTQ